VDQFSTDKLAAAGIRLIPIKLRRATIAPWSDLVLIVRLISIFRREMPDVLLSYTIKPVIYGGLASWLAGVPRRYALITGLGYAFIGGSFRQRCVNRIASFLYRISLARYHRVLFQNADDQKLFIQRRILQKSAPCAVVPGSGVDLDHFSRQPLPSSPDGERVFLMIGRLIRDKGVFEFVEAARQVRRDFPRARFQILGELEPGRPEAVTKANIDSWASDGTIEYLGTAVDVRPHIVGCHVYVLPSYREGLPRSTLEALAIGRPIITTDVPGCRETVRTGWNGLLVEPRNAKFLADAMRRACQWSSPELTRLSENSRQYCEASFSVDLIVSQMLRELAL